MSAPTSFKGMHSLFIDPILRKKHTISYVFYIWLSFIPMMLLEAIYYHLYLIIPSNFTWLLIILIPVNIMSVYYVTIVVSIIIMRFRLFILKIRHKPREGVFKRDINNTDYKFHSLRNYARLLPAFLISSSPFPLFKKFLYYRAFGVNIGEGGIQQGSWIPVEFIEIGDDVIFGMGSVLMSYIIESDHLLIQKIKIGNNVIVGSKTVVFPGVIIEDNVILSGSSHVLLGQTLKKDSVYFGHPAKFMNKRDEINFEISSKK